MDKNFQQRVLDLVNSHLLDQNLNYEVDLVEGREMTILVSYDRESYGAWEADSQDWRPEVVLHLTDGRGDVPVELTCTVSALPPMSPAAMRVMNKVWVSALELVALLNFHANGIR